MGMKKHLQVISFRTHILSWSYDAYSGPQPIWSKVFFSRLKKRSPLKRFYGRTNIVLMFLFPWLDWGNDISDFEKIDFLGSWAIFGLLSPLQQWFFDMGDNFEGPIKSAQCENFEKDFSGIFQKISKVSKNIIWASCDHVVAQKSIF